MNSFWLGFEKQANRHHDKRLAKAISERGPVHITYRKLNGRTVKRKVTPYEVKGNLLIGHDHKREAVRSYRMDRLTNVQKWKKPR